MTHSANALLIITDGTSENTASMIVTVAGAHLQDWLPKSPSAASAIWSSTPYQDGKQLVSKSYDNIIDTFILAIDSDTMDTTIFGLRKFIKLLEDAITYWTEEYSTHKFWLEIRGECETEIRYALVVDYSIPEIDNPFAPPFEPTPESTLDNISLSIEHTIWTDTLEVGSECVSLSTNDATQGLAGRVDGAVPTEQDDDAWANDDGAISLNATKVWAGLSGGDEYSSGIRFRSVLVPQGATILSAYIIFQSTDDAIIEDCETIISCELDAHPAVFSTNADFFTRVRTTLMGTYWTIPPTANGNLYTTPDFSASVQAVVNLAGWASGHNLVVFVDETGLSDANAIRYFASFDHLTYAEPKLYITYEDNGTIVTTGEEGVCGTAQIASIAGWKSKGITHAFYHDVSVGFGSNQVDDALGAHDILGATPNMNDFFYVGREDDNGGYPFPFNNVVFDLAVLGTDGDGHWEYSTGGGAFSNLTYVDFESDDFARANTTLGFHIVIWDLPINWVQDTINGIYGLWVRYVVASNGISSPHQAANKAIYSIYKPEIIIDEDSIKGDIHAVLDYLLQIYGYHDKLVIALKSYARTNGGLFTPYIPLRADCGGDTLLLPPGVRYDIALSAATETTDTQAYCGRNTTWSPGALAIDQLMLDLYLNTKTYVGRYHVFLRSHITTGVTGQFSFYLELYTPSGSFISEPKATVGINGFDEWIDLGTIAFSQAVIFEVGADTYETRLSLFGNTTDAGVIILYDLVLVPIDEGVFEILHNGGNVSSGMGLPYKVVTSNPKPGSYCFMEAKDSGDLYLNINWDETLYREEMLSILGSSLIKPKEKYHLYFFPICTDYASGFKLIKQFLFPILGKHQRYLFARGDE